MRGRLSRSRRLELDEYLRVRRVLRNPKDFAKFNLPNYVLSSILNQKIVDYAIRNFNRYDAEKVAEVWKRRGKIGIRLPPVLRLKLLMKGLGYSKSEISAILRNPKEAGDLEELVWDAVTRDFVYSPLAISFQHVKGRLGERLIEEILVRRGLDFKTERELKTRKTPDFLLSEVVEFEGYRVRWIESKFMFGDVRTHSFYWRRQYHHYFRDFGRGVVVYWPWHVNTPFSLSGDVEMVVRFRFGRLKRERFLRVVEEVIKRFERGEEIEVKGNVRLLRFLEGLGFKVLPESRRSS